MSWGWAPMSLTAIVACAPHAPPPMTLVKPDWRSVTAFLDSAVAAGAAPGAVLGVSVAGRRFVYATGQLGADEGSPATPLTLYDIASVTKVVGLTTAVMLAVDEGKLDLDARVQLYVPEFAGEGKERVTSRMLLAHVAGMPAWRPLFRETRSRAEAFALANQTPLRSPPLSGEVYSDLGLIVITQAIEASYGTLLDSVLLRRVFQPLGMASTVFNPPVAVRSGIAPTELDPWRGRVLRGEVHDQNAARLDGVSGHAGLFASAPDLLTFAEWMLAVWHGSEVDGGPTISSSTVREFTRRQDLVPGSSRAIGWDTPSPRGSAGSLLSPRSFGHLGFTGTSLWIEPERRLAVVLLSNRVNPTRDNPRWNPVRSALADLVVTTLFEDAR